MSNNTNVSNVNISDNKEEKRIPAYYAIIPAHVRYCKELDLGARMLYGEITALSSMEGYCWASNEYFSDLYDVDERTIRRWITSLEELGFIVREIEKKGMVTKRKLWISTDIKEILTRGHTCPPRGGQQCPPGQDTHVPHINTSTNNTRERKEKSKKESPILNSHGDHVKLSTESYQDFCKTHGKPLVEEVIQEINDYISSVRGKPYLDYPAVMRGWIKRNKQKQVKTYYQNQTDLSRHQGLNKDFRQRKTTLDLSDE